MVGGLVFTVNRALAAPPVDLVVNSTAWGGADTNPGNGSCETATVGVCTLRAAIEEANALNRAPGEVKITVDPSIPLDTFMTGTANATADFMLYTNNTTLVNRGDLYGARYHVTASVEIDLGHRLRSDSSANNNTANAMFYINGPGVQILNADYVLSSGSSFVIGPNARDVVIDGDTTGSYGGDGLGRIVTERSNHPDRFVVVMQGAQGVTVRNYHVAGYSEAANSGIFVFSNTSISAPTTNITRDVVFDNIQVNYASSGTCSATNGSGCRTNITTFWQNNTAATYDGGNNGGYANNVIEGLTFNNLVVENLPSPRRGLVFANRTLTQGVSDNSAKITDLTITNNRFLNNATAGPSYYSSEAFLFLPYVNSLLGTNRVTGNVFTCPSSGYRSAAIFWLGTRPDNSTDLANLKIENNYFNGCGTGSGATTGWGTVRLQGAGLATVSGNTFGTATYSQATTSNNGAAEETSDTNIMFSNSTVQYLNSNKAVLTWFPENASGKEAKVLTGEVPAGAFVMNDAFAGLMPTCPVVATATNPPTPGTYTTIPGNNPVTLQAYWTSGHTAEIYLGQVKDVQAPAGSSKTVVFSLPIGTVTLPDGTTASIVNSSGAVNGYIRFQTQVQYGDHLSSSQYSRVSVVRGDCRPILTINRAAGMAEPTYARDLLFTLQSTMPLDPATVTAADIALTVTPLVAPVATIDPARLNPQVTVTPVPGSNNTLFDVVVRVDDSARVAVAVPAGAVATEAGLTNTAAASSTVNHLTYLNPLRVDPPVFTVVTGEPRGQDFTISLASGAPLPNADLAFTAAVEQPVGAPDVFVNPMGPMIRSGQMASDPIKVTAADGQVLANTPVPITLTVASADSNYDGLVVPSAQARLFSTDPNIQITKQAFTEMSDSSSVAGIMATGREAHKGQRLLDGEPVCFIYTVTNTSPDDWPTSLTDVTVVDTDRRLMTDGVIGIIPLLERGESEQLFACAVLIPKDTTAEGGS